LFQQRGPPPNRPQGWTPPPPGGEPIKRRGPGTPGVNTQGPRAPFGDPLSLFGEGVWCRGGPGGGGPEQFCPTQRSANKKKRERGKGAKWERGRAKGGVDFGGVGSYSGDGCGNRKSGVFFLCCGCKKKKKKGKKTGTKNGNQKGGGTARDSSPPGGDSSFPFFANTPVGGEFPGGGGGAAQHKTF